MPPKRLYQSTASPSPLPPHVRPSISRHASSSSTSSQRHPHSQQREFVPSNVDGGFTSEAGASGLGERWAFEHAEHPTPGGPKHHRVNSDSESDEEDEDGEGSEADWAAAKELDDARRPAWRRASPRWLYPFISGATLALGMGMAPRSELYVNLACLVHPPAEPSALTSLSAAAVTPEVGGIRWGMYSLHSEMVASASASTTAIGTGTGNSTDTVGLPTHPAGDRTDDLSAADRWFYRLQHDIYEYESKHTHHSSQPSTPPSPSDHSRKPSVPLPTSPGSGNTHQPPQDGGGHEEKQPPSPTEPAGPSYKQIDPKACKRDPKVQAVAAKLVMMTGGILSALTTGYWGQMSDRWGRTKVMALMETGLLLNEACFITVATFPYLVPGGYRALLLGPTLEGLLGGISTLTATASAYVSDSTPDGSRAAVFARVGGTFMLGMAFGPVLGSSVIKATGNIMTPFYINVGLHLFYVIMILLVLPESLSKEARTILSKNAKLAADAQKRQDMLAREWENETPSATPDRSDPFLAVTPGSVSEVSEHQLNTPSKWNRRLSMISGSGANGENSRRQKRLRGWLRRSLRRYTAFLQPLSVFMPVDREDGGRDYNMTIMAAALFSMSLMMGVYQVKSQYTIYAFGWTSAQLGPYMSLLGFLRGFFMLVILPLTMRFAKPYFVPRPTSPPAAEPASSSFTIASGVSAAPSTPGESSPLVPRVKIKRPATLDLWTARISLGWEATMYLILTLGLPEWTFIAVTSLITLSSGTNAAANSLALSFIPNSREAGKLFGGIAVLHALGSTLLGPLAFGTLFSYTIGGFTPAVWLLAGLIQGASLVLMCFVRIPREKGEGDAAAERGRSKRIKSVRSSSGLQRN